MNEDILGYEYQDYYSPAYPWCEIEDSFWFIVGEQGNMNIVKSMVNKKKTFDIHECIRRFLGLDNSGNGHSGRKTIFGKTYYDPNIALLNICLRGACKGGHISIIKFLIEQGANDWVWGLYYACLGQHMIIIEFMISKGKGICDWSCGLQGACRGGNMDIINLIIAHGSKDWITGFWGACYGGHMDIVNMMNEKIETTGHRASNHWRIGAKYASIDMHMPVISLMMEKAENHPGCDRITWNNIYDYACTQGNKELMDLSISNGAVHDRYNRIFPYHNKKTKFFHNDLYYENPKGRFMYGSILYWAIVYDRYYSLSDKMIQKDLTPELLKLLYF